jgi:hypothetical protein
MRTEFVQGLALQFKLRLNVTSRHRLYTRNVDP